MKAMEKNTHYDSNTQTLLDSLLELLRPLGRLVVAYSGGVDSTLVVAAAAKALGAENVLAVTADSETLPARELEEAIRLAKELSIPHSIIETKEMDKSEFYSNPPDRCYHCKSELWSRIRDFAGESGISHLADGANADDTRDHRPGIKAGDEAGVFHPLMEIGAGKEKVRALAKYLGLPNWDKPAQACLSSRFPYGSTISVKSLQRVEKAEEFLRDLGLSEFRVRDHGDIARIEVSADLISSTADNGSRNKIIEKFKSLGYKYIALDLEGYRSGSMNEML